MRLFRLAAVGGIGCLCLLALGCEKEDPIRVYQAPKEPAHVHRERIEWKIPADWVEWTGDAQTNTYAGFTLEATTPPLEMTVTILPRQAPSAADVTANVNRWQAQIKMPLSPQEEVDRLAQKLSIDGREGYAVDLSGPENRILGAMAVEGDRVWFFKIMGASARVEKHKQEFQDFLSSLKLNGPRKEFKGQLAFNTPPGWSNAGDRPMRELTFLVGNSADPAEVMVTRLPGTSFGTILDNINRWRAQVGLAPAAKVEDQPSEKIKLAGADAAYFDFVGPGTPEKSNRRMLLAMTVNSNEVWFFKIIGPQQLVAAEKKNFEDFLKSIEMLGTEAAGGADQ